MSNWKTLGPDFVQGFWLKNMTNMQARLVDQLNACLMTGKVPQWMTKGRTLLFVKDPILGNGASNYRPITCLPLMYELLTGMISEDMDGFLDENDLLRDEQKDARKQSRGAHDLLFIDLMVMRNARARNKTCPWPG